ncbi:histidine acid phosphatase [Teladorsagia circumcincta]|uniref:acid phosphatase n=1 Tax=Teladorsagia circumcincta TaxID=45464 RepID=A0A2G9V5M3_TELCI|nr:histidine acid phosphatase [Teladorsagia circumcincta]
MLSFKPGRLQGDEFSDVLGTGVYFRSKANNRCLMTAALVGRGMFNSAERLVDPPVPVYSQIKGDYLLDSAENCEIDRARIYKTCGRYPEVNYDRHQNGLPMANWFIANKDEVYKSFAKVDNFIVGSGEYHDPAILRLKCGFLLYTIFKHLESSWEAFYTQGRLDRKKFIAYSTQDWLMQSLMDAMGIRWAAVRQFAPTYNSMIILELRKVKDQPVIKAFYRDPARGMNDVTSAIRGCETHQECPLSSVLSCCPQYLSDNPEKDCHQKPFGDRAHRLTP